MKTHSKSTLAGLFIFIIAPFAHGQPNDPALPPIATVDYDQHGGFRVNGKAFFPISLYDAPINDETLRELREFGFNVLACDPKVCDALPAKGFYGAVHASTKIDNLKGVLLAIGYDSPALYLKKNLLQQVAESNAKLRAAVPGRPVMNAIGYWEDEPAGVVAGKLPSKEKYEDLVNAIDVSAPYLYPIPYQPVASVGEAVAKARKATGGKKPVLAVLQLFVWKAKDRYPTPAELRCMAFLSLVEGATGIGWYSYSTVTGQPKTTIARAQPELWKSVKKLNHDIARIGPRLVAGAESDAFSLEKSKTVKGKIVDDKNAVLAVLVNSAATPQEARLVWQKADTSGKLMLEGGKQLEIKNGVATLRLEPFGVEIIGWSR